MQAQRTRTRRSRAFLSSTRPLPNGEHQMEIPADKVWSKAREMGLRKEDYGSWWFVYESKADYLESLD